MNSLGQKYIYYSEATSEGFRGKIYKLFPNIYKV